MGREIHDAVYILSDVLLQLMMFGTTLFLGSIGCEFTGITIFGLCFDVKDAVSSLFLHPQ